MKMSRSMPLAAAAWLALTSPAFAQDESAESHGGGAATAEAPAEEAKAEKTEEQMMREEIARLKLEYELLTTRNRLALAESELRKAELNSAAGLRKAERDEELAEMRAETDRLRAETALASAQRAVELEEMNSEAARLNAENAMLTAESKRLQTELTLMRTEMAARTAEMEGQLAYLAKKNTASNKVMTEIGYPLNPLIDGTLYISDRRIPLNGPISSGSANYVTERIHFFNNQSDEKPIFIVIDNCPGGSVMEGYRIVKAIESSQAPVHVVVKSFAASMAAVITTLADHSYAYPNAIILHHQMSYGTSGNMTQHREQFEMSTEWMRRLAEPVADKMGVSLDRFIEMMYENNSDGDWEEFADRAVELNWVNKTVEEIREDGIIERPTTNRFGSFFLEHEQIDPTSGQRFVRLPRLSPFDFYAIYDPENYWRE